MLKNLHVKNLALIDEAEVTFNEGLNILSGETGAGKSIIIDSSPSKLTWISPLYVNPAWSCTIISILDSGLRTTLLERSEWDAQGVSTIIFDDGSTIGPPQLIL